MSEIEEEVVESEEIDPVVLFQNFITMKKARERALDILDDIEAKMATVSAELEKHGIFTEPPAPRVAAPSVSPAPSPVAEAPVPSAPVERDGTEDQATAELAGGSVFRVSAPVAIDTPPQVDPSVAAARKGAGVESSGDSEAEFARSIAGMFGNIQKSLG